MNQTLIEIITIKTKYMSIKITGLEKYLEKKASRICLGTFDGFHQGHQKLAAEAEFMVTFEPHPKEILLESNTTINNS